MTNRSHFQRNGRGVFTCCVCDRKTRTVDQSQDSECCPQCWELAGFENMVQDGMVDEIDWADVDGYVNEAVKLGGNRDKILAECSILFDARPAAEVESDQPAVVAVKGPTPVVRYRKLWFASVKLHGRVVARFQTQEELDAWLLQYSAAA